ncbi:MAG TPA: hypothetical protein VFW75_08885, partial [Acetobacteraceae bacterium]|nr:hypothetical protein [Acetobacteraceae bacterium]
FTLKDFDGDTDSSTLSVTSTASGFKPIVRDDVIISNVDDNGGNEAIVVPGAALLWNDADPDGDTLTLSNTFTNVANLVSVALAAGDVTVTDGQDGGSFTYSASSTDGSDTGNVTLDRHQEGDSTLDGDGLDNILVGRNGENDTILAHEGNDVLIGGGGDDNLDGGDGRDWLIGGDGNDTLSGGKGDDLIEGGNGSNDILDFSDVGTNWSFTLGVGGSGTATIQGTDTYSGIEGVIGGDGDNIITGNTGSNTLSGGDGDDTLDGGNDAVADVLNGGSGDDTLIWRGANDTYNGGSSNGNNLENSSGDILDVSSGTTIDLTSIANSQFSSLETIRMNGGGNQTVTLNSQDVVDFGSGTFDPQGKLPSDDAVRIEGDSGDVLNLSAGTGQWVEITGDINNEPSGYRVFAFDTVPGGSINQESYVIVDQDVTVNNVA